VLASLYSKHNSLPEPRVASSDMKAMDAPPILEGDESSKKI
jgi:hypothetical protein